MITDSAVAKVALKKLLDVLHKKLNVVTLYVEESQKRGAVHYHLFIFDYNGNELPSSEPKAEEFVRRVVFPAWNNIHAGTLFWKANPLRVHEKNDVSLGYFLKEKTIRSASGNGDFKTNWWGYLQSPDPKNIPTAGPAVTPDPFSLAGDLLEGLLLSKIQRPIQADLSALSGMRYYPDSQYLLVREPNWFAAVRMSSGRTSTWKSMLGYNLYGSSTAEFSIALMTDGREYDDTTIPTMNWKRLMGVTRCDVIEPPPEGYGQSAFCGGLAGDEFAVLGLQYLLAPAGQDTLRGNKSVFVTPNALVLLGSQIKCDSATPVVTTLFHAPVITDDGQYRRNNTPLDVHQNGAWEITAGETLQLRNISIRLLTDAQLIIETRRGSYADLNMQEVAPKPTPATAAYYAVHERRWVYLVVNHGVRPANGRYGAVITAGKPAALQIVHEDGHHRVAMSDGSTGGEVRYPGDWRKPIGSSYWGAEQHQWGSIARWTPSDAPSHANLEITPPARFVIGSENANTEIFLPDGFVQEGITLKTYAGQPFPANLISLPAKGQVLKLRVRRVAAG